MKKHGEVGKTGLLEYKQEKRAHEINCMTLRLCVKLLEYRELSPLPSLLMIMSPLNPG